MGNASCSCIFRDTERDMSQSWPAAVFFFVFKNIATAWRGVSSRLSLESFIGQSDMATNGTPVDMAEVVVPACTCKASPDRQTRSSSCADDLLPHTSKHDMPPTKVCMMGVGAKRSNSWPIAQMREKRFALGGLGPASFEGFCWRTSCHGSVRSFILQRGESQRCVVSACSRAASYQLHFRG